MPAAGGPPPLTQIHFQDLSPLPGGGGRVNLTSQAFEIPGVRAARRERLDRDHLRTDQPVRQPGRLRGLQRRGRLRGKHLPERRPLRGARAPCRGSRIRPRSSGATAPATARRCRALDTSAMDGFATDTNEELMMQVALGNGHRRPHVCAGGTRTRRRCSRRSACTRRPTASTTAADRHGRDLLPARRRECRGTATLTLAGKAQGVGHAGFALPGRQHEPPPDPRQPTA